MAGTAGTFQVFYLTDDQTQSEQPWLLIETLALAGFEPATDQLQDAGCFFIDEENLLLKSSRKIKSKTNTQTLISKSKTGVELIFGHRSIIKKQ